MPYLAVERVVQLSAGQAFAIAADVASYKTFVPLVTRSVVRGTVEKLDDVEKFAADLTVAVERLNLRESFTSTVEADAARKTVIAISQDGPMKNLKAVWKISALGENQARISIEIDYQFKNMLLQIAAGGFMNSAVQRVLEAFESRGRELYSRPIA